MQPAARLGDFHACPMVTPGTPPVPHVGGPILPTCSIDVLVGNLPAARVSDRCLCVGPPDVIVKGSPTVLINNLPAARMGDTTAHGGVITVGMPTVLIGQGSNSGGGGGGASAGAGQDKKAKAQREESFWEYLWETGEVLLDAAADTLASVQAEALRMAAEVGVPFCEACAKAARERMLMQSNTAADAQAMAADVYLPESDEGSLPDHINRISEQDAQGMFPGSVWQDEETGFKARAYENTETGEITVAFAGTEDGNDWGDNIQQGLTGDAPQYRQARDFAQTVSAHSPDEPGALSFTGHSLGGGLTLDAVTSLETQNHRNAHTFNPAGLSDTVGEVPGRVSDWWTGKNENIHNHHISGDPLTILNSATPGMGTPGNEHYYSSPSWNPLENHSIDAFEGQLDED